MPRCSLGSWTSLTGPLALLFGDGAGAVVLEASDEFPASSPPIMHADGKHVDILCVPGSVSAAGEVLGDPLLKMDGQAVFKLAVGVLEESARAVAGQGRQGPSVATSTGSFPTRPTSASWQSTARKRLKLSMDHVMVTVDQHGNTSAASIPLALDHGCSAVARILPGQIP